jgi:hypothetical protein
VINSSESEEDSCKKCIECLREQELAQRAQIGERGDKEPMNITLNEARIIELEQTIAQQRHALGKENSARQSWVYAN